MSFPLLYRWVIVVWLVTGVASVVASLGVWLILSETAEIALLVLSLAIGLALSVGAFLFPGSGKKFQDLPMKQRISFVLFVPLMTAWLSLGNLYMMAVLIHVTIAAPASTSFTVSWKRHRPSLPWRCEREVFFREVRIMSLKRLCVSAEEFDRIQPSSRLAIVGSRSPLGFKVKAEDIALHPQASPIEDAGMR